MCLVSASICPDCKRRITDAHGGLVPPVFSLAAAKKKKKKTEEEETNLGFTFNLRRKRCQAEDGRLPD